MQAFKEREVFQSQGKRAKTRMMKQMLAGHADGAALLKQIDASKRALNAAFKGKAAALLAATNKR